MEAEAAHAAQPSTMETCFECEEDIATLYCLKCEIVVCHQCDQTKTHASKRDRFHERIQLDSAGPFLQFKCDMAATESAPTAGAILEDTGNLLIGAFPCATDADTCEIRLGPYFSSFANIPEKEAMPVCSFIGPSGVGKSFLMKQMCSQPPYPIAGQKGIAISTSQDLHAYWGDYLTPADDHDTGRETPPIAKKFVLIDSEGFGGRSQTTTSTLSEAVSTAVSTVGAALTSAAAAAVVPFRKSRGNDHGHGIIPPGHSTRKFDEEKSKVVHTVYPRLLYMFSDVLVFVFQGNLRQQQIAQDLIRYAKMAAAGIINRAIRPTLLIIFNKIVKSDLLKMANGNIAWKITDASESWLSQLGPEHEALRTYYHTVNVLIIPDAAEHFAQAFKQIGVLREFLQTSVRNSIDRKKRAGAFFPRADVCRLLQIAVNKLSEDHDAQFNFLDLIARNERVGEGIANFLFPFFKHVEAKLKADKTSSIDPYLGAVKMVQNRIGDLVFLYMTRNNLGNFTSLGQPDCDLPQNILGALRQVQNDFRCMMPCAATEEFGDEKKKVGCDVRYYWHLKDEAKHESTETYTITSNATDTWYQRLFGMQETIQQACHWPGQFCESSQLADIKNTDFLVSAAEKFIRTPNETWSTTLHCNQYVQSKDFLRSLNARDVCLGCLLAFPSIRLPCGCFACKDCCIEFKDCVLCGMAHNYAPHTSVPKGSGFRVLSLDGGGVRGVVTALILQRLQKLLFDMPITNFFDYIIGTSAGGISALALTTIPNCSPDTVIKLFRNMAKTAFTQAAFGMHWPLLGWFIQWKYGYKYTRKGLHDTLATHLPSDKLLLGASTSGGVHVATVTCSDASGAIQTVLCTSYHRLTTSQGVQICTDMDILSAAEATSAAPTLFPVFQFNNINYIDGAMSKNNNPCLIGRNEGHKLWPAHQCDLVVSLGTGKSNKPDSFDNDVMKMVKLAVNIVTDAEDKWKELLQEMSEEEIQYRAHRINPVLPEWFELDDVAHMERIISMTSSWLNHHDQSFQLNSLCMSMLASVFYFKIDETESTQGAIVGTINSRCSIPCSLRTYIATLARPFELRDSGVGEQKLVYDRTDITYVENVMQLGVRIEPLSKSANIFICSNLNPGPHHHTVTSLPPISGCPFEYTWSL